MKKILLGTTTLVGAAALFAGAAFAGETPKVTVGGFADFQVGVVGEDLNAAKRPQAFRSDTEVTFNIDGKTDAGLTYGGAINLEADTTDDADNQGVNASKTYVYLGGAFGRVEMGSNVAAQQTLKIGAESIARATGGIDGDYTYFMTGSPTFGQGSTSQVIATPDLPLNYGNGQFGDESTENLNNVTYYTPRFAGFQAGVSYIVDNTSRGQTVNRFNDGAAHGGVTATADNIIAGGLNYETTFKGVALGAAVTGEHGSSAGSTLNDLEAWNAGLKAGYMGFTLAGSYGSQGDSLRLKSIASDSDSSYWTVGGAYEFGPFAASVTYLSSEYDLGATHNDFSNISVGADYKLAPGFTPYAEVSFVKLDPTTTANDNDATVFIAGTQLAF